ncbi:hypothetical protein FBU59_007065 [Linderina macrospora]|uniref:Uncharacterized protein n=1 Tax=Linderina macrospora TaxID=4868 RepID=A0ACC1IY62_9FUNG|nr:hypothetical protein FBU59_007065 [Linderina macrospora]
MSEAVADLVQPKAEPEQVQPATATESQLDDSDQPDAAESKEEGTADHHPVGSKVVCDETSMLDEKLSVCVTRVPSQTPTLSESEGVSETVTLRHIYSIFCWLHCKDNNKMWRDDPLAACQKAVTDCRFMADADPEKLKAKLDEIRTIHAEIIEKYGGAEKVPQDLRVVPGGPLFNIVNFIFTGQCLKTKGADCRLNSGRRE